MNQKMQQRMIMTPMLQQAMKILQLSTLELKEWVEKEMLENPVLEEEVEETSAAQADKAAPTESPTTPPGDPETSDETAVLELARQRHQTDLVEHMKEGDRFEKGTWDLYNESAEYGETSDSEYGGRERSDGEQEKRDFMEASLTRAQTLAESLEWQLLLVAKDEREKTLGKVIIGNLDENGYLTDKVEDIAVSQNVTVPEIEKALQLIQTFEPAGVGARNLRECLLLQLENKTGEVARRAYLVALDHFEDMEKRKYGFITKALGITDDQLREVLGFVASLEPKPGRSFQDNETKYITPDVSVRKIEGEYVVVLNDEPVPKLRISSYYRRLLKDKSASSNKETKKFLEGKIQSALWLIKNIEQRRKTIYRVTEAIFRIQRDFLEVGISALKPLTLKQVADMIGMHESTVSRVTTHKYVQTERGIFELKFFFTSGLESVSGLDVSSMSVKEKIKDMVGQEPPQKPYSDQKIMQLLNDQGLSIARRTIAKYREELRIPSASQRRKL
ncbi:MAG TPA: RNA polymerase factor sigma-54 [bacterium]|nr:RNA polymerase factor sigma-54 [bacterium]